jgi:5S rRNA maturation endonuclease (ribonuclease M5)
MAGSNGEWGELASQDQDMADAWDRFARLPSVGQNVVLDAFVERKRITINSLIRCGARLSTDTVLAFAFPEGVKYRDMVSGKRWAWMGARFTHMKIIPAGDNSDTVIICEGETDACRLTILYPDVDIAVLPVGARTFTDTYRQQVTSYSRVYVALDDDEAGNEGAKTVMDSLPSSARLMPPANDWCEVPDGEEPPLPDIGPPRSRILFGREMLEMPVPDVNSWFSDALLPIGGSLLLHGWKSCFKSWLALDMMSCIATGREWGRFEATEEAAKVCVFQWEIPHPFYHERCSLLRELGDTDLWDENFGTIDTMRRPDFVAGSAKHEEAALRALLDAGISVVLFDPVRRAGRGGDLNDEKDAGVLLGFFERLMNEGMSVVYVAHDNKAGSKAGGADILNVTGSGAWVGDADSVVTITVPKGETTDSRYRNLNFTIRNGPHVEGRSFHIDEDAHIIYSNEPTDNIERVAVEAGMPSI